MNTHQQTADLALWGQIMTNAAYERNRVDEMATALHCAGTDITDDRAIIMLLMHRGFAPDTIGPNLNAVIDRVRDLKRSHLAAFDTHFPANSHHAGSPQ